MHVLKEMDLIRTFLDSQKNIFSRFNFPPFDETFGGQTLVTESFRIHQKNPKETMRCCFFSDFFWVTLPDIIICIIYYITKIFLAILKTSLTLLPNKTQPLALFGCFQK